MFLRFPLVLAAVFCLLSIGQLSPAAQEKSAGAAHDPPAPAPHQGLDDKLLDGLPAGPAKERQVTDPADRTAAERTPVTPPAGVLDPFAEGSDIGPQDPLQRIGRQMQLVQERLFQRDVSSQTQQTQQQIVTELDELIAALAAQQKSSLQRRRSPSPGDDQQALQTGKQAARDSDGQPGNEETRAAETAAMQQAADEIWGHLPERFRRHMQNPGAIEFLPKYRRLIEDYYKRLAEDHGHQQ